MDLRVICQPYQALVSIKGTEKGTHLVISLQTMTLKIATILTLLVLALASVVPAEEGKKRSAEQLLTRVMRNDFLIRALRSPSTRPSVIRHITHFGFYIYHFQKNS